MHAFIGTKRQKNVTPWVSAWLMGTKPITMIPIIYTESVAVNDLEITSTFDSLHRNWNVHSYNKYLLVNYFEQQKQ